MLLFLLAIALVLIVHQYSRAIDEQSVRQLAKDQPVVDGFLKLHAPGHLGQPVTIPSDQVPAAIQEQIADGWKRQGYNQFVSDLISVHREMPDVRDPWCLRKKPGAKGLQPVSIVIVFHDEALSVLLRTVHSVLHRSPPALIQEIVLVDDWSSLVQLKTFLDDYFLPHGNKIRILRTPQRLGLIRGRIYGARRATGRYLLFLDAHCECLEGWLEPLLEVVSGNVDDPSTSSVVVAVPTIDWLNESTLALQTKLSDGLYGAFDWNLSFQWRPRYDRASSHPENLHQPFDSPVLTGGLFCIAKEFFARLGWYDPGLQIHGGENMELSFKVWMCGGTIKVVPCSHVAQIQKRNHPYIASYTRERQLTMKNSLRVAEVWMDEYAEFLYRLHPDYRTLLASRSAEELEDLSKRKQIRTSLACHPFRWYMRTVFPEQDDPTGARSMGWLRAEAQQHANHCLDWPMRDRTLALRRCHGLGGHQLWFHNARGEITREGHCLQVEDGPQGHKERVTMALCSFQDTSDLRQQWHYQRETGQLRNMANGLCLIPSESYSQLGMETCHTVDVGSAVSPNATEQKWTFQIDNL